MSCEVLIAVCTRDRRRFGPLYIRLGTVWHRFYLDAGLLFWEEGVAPDSDEDLLSDEEYLDIADILNVRGVTLTEIDMSESTMLMRFANGARIVLKHEVRSEYTELIEMSPGPLGTSR